ncbi:response regulator transcription factor [Aminipila luticellarii]|uniref:LuxR family transcriptional regulator n=1 Tax=Aminipila luticellarii TaxID=2507160 RepID=A0A410PV29_9FIRM|nr:LuxR family transcriptional regulator [Aminipila luticellarii]
MSYLKEEEWVYISNMIYKLNLETDERMKRLDFLRDLRTLIPYTGASFYLGDAASSTSPLVHPVGIDIPDGKFEEYEQYYYKMGYASRFYPLVSSIILRQEDIASDEQRKFSEYYNQYLKGIDYTLDTYFANLSGILGEVALSRKKELGPFKERELFIMKILEPHITNRLYLMKLANKNNNPLNNDALQNEYNLTYREMQILNLVLQGKRNIEIADSFDLSESTVKKHLSNVFHKCKVKNRLQLIDLVMKKKHL